MVKIDIKPLSINAAFQGRRFKTPAYKKYTDDLQFLLPPIKLPEPPYHIIFEFGFSSKASDWDNCIKTTQDAIAQKYGFDDKLIRRGWVDTEIVPKGQEYFKFQIIEKIPLTELLNKEIGIYTL